MPKQRIMPADEPRSGVDRQSPRNGDPDTRVESTKTTEDQSSESRPKEYGGRNGPDPVRYGDWEKNGRCIDF